MLQAGKYWRSIIQATFLTTLVALPIVWSGTTAQGDWPPMNPGTKTFFVQGPDHSTNGIDVLACPFEAGVQPGVVLADDWICRGPSPLTDVHIWGSWLNNLVDPALTFWIGIWSDTAATPDTPSHPNQLLYAEEFGPGKYRARVWTNGVQERFMDPTVPAFMGSDNQIYQYNFYLTQPFYQQGTPERPVVYWLSVMAKTSAGRFFGWKTTRDHFNDAGVFAIMPFGIVPGDLIPWQVVQTPAGRKLEFAFAMTSAQTWAINKNFFNLNPFPVFGAQVRVPGYYPIIDHFDGPMDAPWNFTYEWVTNSTVLTWATPLVPVLAHECIHVGYSGPGIYPPLLNWGWWNPFQHVWNGNVVQFNLGFPYPLPPTPYLIGITNILPPPFPPRPGFSNYLQLASLAVEYYDRPVPLAALNTNGVRTPMATVPVMIPPPLSMIAPGANVQLSVPAPPTGASYAVVVAQSNPVSDLGVPQSDLATLDWIQLPTTLPDPEPPTPQAALLPPSVRAREITLRWTSIPGGIYQLLSRASLDGADGWDEEDGRIIADGPVVGKTLPLDGGQRFYRVESIQPQ